MKKVSILLTGLLTLAVSCTNVEEKVYDKMLASEYYRTPDGIESVVGNLYNEMRGDWNGKGVAGADRGWFDMNETCTDELMLPTRSDGAWDDGGLWRDMYQHKWLASQAFMENTWNWLYRVVYKANQAVELLRKANAAPEKIAEARVLRAYYYYMLMDGWGSIPFYTENTLGPDQIPQASRTEVYNFVVKELTESVDLLPTKKPVAGDKEYGRFNKWAGYTVLAKVYLNAAVYTGTAKWTEAAAACDKIINEGGYSLVTASDYFTKLFGDKCDPQEVILPIFVDANLAPRNIIGIRSLRGAHGQALFGFDTWNGGTAHQDFVNKYEANDIRKAQWLTGPQPGGVNYSLSISSLTAAGTEDGARNAKFLPVPPYNGGSSSNDFPIYRYADVLLMKAEAILRNGNAAGAKTLYDQVRQRAGLAASVGNPTLDNIYDERGRELCWEGHRRQDMIRFGKFLAAHDFKAVSDSKYLVFPIPANVLSVNRNIKQNPGY